MIENSLELPCGVVLKNRIAKSAMSEAMANNDFTVNQKFINLYDRWAKGGAGLLITGNIMIDKRCLGEAHNVVFEEGMNVEMVKAWTKSVTDKGVQFWAQLNHPGKQSPKFLSKEPFAPSSIAYTSKLKNFFNQPRALSKDQIQDIISRFANAAKFAKDNGFTGVQIHGAHGYLVSQFLSPLHNQRKDEWGGSLENRMRFVVNVYQAIREVVGLSFPISIKLNSADFQRGGFSEDESIVVAAKLSSLGMDLIEISGGTYEAPEMTGNLKKSTRDREAYFLTFCEKIRAHVKTPLMLTGGFRSKAAMEAALNSGACDVVGLARSLAVNPDFPNLILSKENFVLSPVKPLTTGFKQIDSLFPLEITWYNAQMRRMAKGLNPKPKMSVMGSVLSTILSIGFQSLKRVRNKN